MNTPFNITPKRTSKPALSKNLAASTAPSNRRKRTTLDLTIPRNHLLTYQVCAEHFGVATAIIMQREAVAQLGVVFDSPFRFLGFQDEQLTRESELVPVTLSFLPSAYALLETIACILRRSMEELVKGLVCVSADTLSYYVKDAMSKGGLDSCEHLADWAKEWLEFEFETRCGRMVVDKNGFDAWIQLEMEHLQPVHFSPDSTIQVSDEPQKACSITIQLDLKRARIFKFYAKHYNVPLAHLMQSEVYGQAGALADDVFGGLEWLESHKDVEGIAGKLKKSVTLEFCFEVFSLLQRLADLLRRPLDEFCLDLLCAGADTLGCSLKDAIKSREMYTQDMKEWGETALRFEMDAKLNKAPGRISNVSDAWRSFNIKRPEVRKALVELQGGLA